MNARSKEYSPEGVYYNDIINYCKFKVGDIVIINKLSWHGQNYENLECVVIEKYPYYISLERTITDWFGEVHRYRFSVSYADIYINSGLLRRKE